MFEKFELTVKYINAKSEFFFQSYPREIKIEDLGYKKQENVSNKTSLNSQYIKFSPRRMF